MFHYLEDIILYDGKCTLCNGLTRFIIRNDRRSKFILHSLSSDQSVRHLGTIGITNYKPDSIVLIKGNNAYFKSDAILLILKKMGGIYSLFYLFTIIPKPVRNLLYDIVASYRHKLFKNHKSCKIPKTRQSSLHRISTPTFNH